MRTVLFKKWAMSPDAVQSGELPDPLGVNEVL